MGVAFLLPKREPTFFNVARDCSALKVLAQTRLPGLIAQENTALVLQIAVTELWARCGRYSL